MLGSCLLTSDCPWLVMQVRRVRAACPATRSRTVIDIRLMDRRRDRIRCPVSRLGRFPSPPGARPLDTRRSDMPRRKSASYAPRRSYPPRRATTRAAPETAHPSRRPDTRSRPAHPRLLPAASRHASASFAADYAQGSGPDPANGLAASGDDRPEPTSATGRAGARPAR
jgi:hypothetical protein